jgi:hypothetical protein
MSEKKNWYNSKTIQGGIINLLVFVSLMFDLGIEESTFISLVQGIFGVIGTVMIIYGRIVAKVGVK